MITIKLFCAKSKKQPLKARPGPVAIPALAASLLWPRTIWARVHPGSPTSVKSASRPELSIGRAKTETRDPAGEMSILFSFTTTLTFIMLTADSIATTTKICEVVRAKIDHRPHEGRYALLSLPINFDSS